MNNRVLIKLNPMSVGLVIIICLVLCPVVGTTQPVYSPEAQAGRAIFNGKGMCSGCHGRDADGQSNLEPIVNKLHPSPPNLRNIETLKYTQDDEVFRFIKERVHGPVTDDEIWQIIAFLREMRKN